MKPKDQAVVVKISRSAIAEAALTLLDWLQTLAVPAQAGPPENDGRRRETVYHDDGSRTERTFDGLDRLVRQVDWPAPRDVHQPPWGVNGPYSDGSTPFTTPPAPHAPRQDQAETD
ncbi:MAG: hypothetical protein WD847_01420 [Pirellulales bacterium]